MQGLSGMQPSETPLPHGTGSACRAPRPHYNLDACPLTASRLSNRTATRGAPRGEHASRLLLILVRTTGPTTITALSRCQSRLPWRIAANPNTNFVASASTPEGTHLHRFPNYRSCKWQRTPRKSKTEADRASLRHPPAAPDHVGRPRTPALSAEVQAPVLTWSRHSPSVRLFPQDSLDTPPRRGALCV